MLFGMPVHLKYDYIGFLVIMVITTILVIGIKESANFTTAVVIMKVAVVCMFIVLAAGVFVFAFLEAELLASLHPAKHRRVGTLWMVGNFARSGRGLLRLYRF